MADWLTSSSFFPHVLFWNVLENSLTSGNCLEFPAIPKYSCENIGGNKNRTKFAKSENCTVLASCSVHFFARSGANVCKYCRSSKMLQNECLVAKLNFDTAEDEPRQVLLYDEASRDLSRNRFCSWWRLFLRLFFVARCSGDTETCVDV